MYKYLNKNISELRTELQDLIKQYNKKRGTSLFIFAAAIFKSHIPDVAMNKDDYYTFYDFLKEEPSENIDIFIETPGGSGDTSEEIARFLHKKFKKISFVIAGEAKSAGTILALSGHDILMTETGSLGPIDAQVRIGRSFVSAHDYNEWINQKRSDAERYKVLNPVDAVMIAQISPGELLQVYHSLKYAQDLVKEWLPNYKFNSWNKTETRQIEVTDEMRKARAAEVAEILTNHTLWREHGRSIKIEDLKNIVQLRVTEVDKDPDLSDLIYRIHTITRMLFSKSSSYKIYAMENQVLFKTAEKPPSSTQNLPTGINESDFDVIKITCNSCKKVHQIYVKFKRNPRIDDILRKKGVKPYPIDDILICDCGAKLNILKLREDIEKVKGTPIVPGGGGLLCHLKELMKRMWKTN
jgi:hypothetical protein